MTNLQKLNFVNFAVKILECGITQHEAIED